MISSVSGLPGINIPKNGEENSFLQSLQGWRALQAMQGLKDKSAIKEEFLTLFYKELLKDTFKPFGNEQNSFSNVFTADFLREKMALELARSQSFSLNDWFPKILTPEVK